MTLAIFGDGVRSMDLFHAIPAPVMDPYLYLEDGQRRVAVVSHIDASSIREVAPDVELLDPVALGWRDLLRSGLDWTTAEIELSVRAFEAVGLRAATVPADFPVGLADRLREAGVTLTVDHQVFQRRRRAKTPAQVAGVRRAQAAADAAMGLAARLVREAADGLSAEGVRGAMQELCDEAGCDLGDEVIVAVGPQSANGHDAGSGPIAAGDVVLVDIWPRDRRSHCWADMSRTFMAGGAPAPDWLAELWALSREALEQVTAAAAPGVDTRELHTMASQVFEAAGEPTQRTAGDQTPERGFLHSLGHGVGLEVHEEPAVGLAGSPLVEGDVIAVEPGAEITGVGGVRLEDLLLVTADGCEVLSRFPYEL